MVAPALPHTMNIQIPCGQVVLEGDLFVPNNAQGIVLFAHGSGSSRFSPRNRFVAAQLNQGNVATLLFDLLTPEEEQNDIYSAHLRFDIELLAKRLACASDFVTTCGYTQELSIGYFGASTGGAAALIAAANRVNIVQAVVTRGGRPDLAGKALPHVQCPTLLIVGGADLNVIPLNQSAYNQLTCPKQLTLVPKATHLFEEPGALEYVAELALEWFQNNLTTNNIPTPRTSSSDISAPRTE